MFAGTDQRLNMYTATASKGRATSCATRNPPPTARLSPWKAYVKMRAAAERPKTCQNRDPDAAVNGGKNFQTRKITSARTVS